MKFLDPSNKGTDIGGLIDPGGGIIEKLTGSNAARKLADPLGVIPGTPNLEATAAEKKKLKGIRQQGQTDAASIFSGSLLR